MKNYNTNHSLEHWNHEQALKGCSRSLSCWDGFPFALLKKIGSTLKNVFILLIIIAWTQSTFSQLVCTFLASQCLVLYVLFCKRNRKNFFTIFPYVVPRKWWTVWVTYCQHVSSVYFHQDQKENTFNFVHFGKA